MPSTSLHSRIRSIQISGTFPTVQCSPEFERLQSPSLVKTTNAWMAEFFGHTEIIPDGVFYELDRETLVMNRATYNKLPATLKELPCLNP